MYSHLGWVGVRVTIGFRVGRRFWLLIRVRVRARARSRVRLGSGLGLGVD